MRRYASRVTPRLRAGARAVVIAIVAIATLAGCYSFAQPSFHPGTARQLLLAIGRRVASVEALVGESACSDRTLVENAIHLKATVASDPVPRDVWIYAFREKGWDATKAAVDACQAEYAAANPGRTITRLDIPVWRAFGDDWSEELTLAIGDALREAANLGITAN